MVNFANGPPCVDFFVDIVEQKQDKFAGGCVCLAV